LKKGSVTNRSKINQNLVTHENEEGLEEFQQIGSIINDKENLFDDK
jgi:hypothetical protein